MSSAQMSSRRWPRGLKKSFQKPRRVVRGYGRRAGSALSVWLSTTGNPFLTRALRIESRAHKPLLSLLGAAIVIALVLSGAWWLWTDVVAESRLGYTFIYPSTGAITPAADQLPRALGSHPIGFFAAITLLVSLLFALHSTRARAASLLRRELLGNTLDGLQMLPIGEERWLWWMSAQPFLLSLLIGVCGLPLYVVAVATGVWQPLDLIGIALLFALCGLVAPSWQPQQWQQQAAQKARRKFGGAVVAVKAKSASTRAQSTLEPVSDAADAIQSDQSATDQSATDQSASGETAAGDAKIEALKKEVGKAKVGRSGPGQWIWVWLAIQLFGGSFRWLLRGSNALSIFWGNFSDSLPPSVKVLLGHGPATIFYSFLNGPLIVERTLFSSLPFFAHALPPLLLMLPFFLLSRHQQLVTLGSRVTAMESFWSARRLRRKREIGAVLWGVIGLIFFGFGWQSLVNDGVLQDLLRGAPFNLTPTADWSLAALWTGCLVIGTLIGASAMEGPVRGACVREKLADSMEIGTLPQFWGMMAKLACRALGALIVIYFGMCWLGKSNAFNAAWQSRLPATLAMSLSFLVADWGSGALQTAVAPDLRAPIRMARLMWFVGLAALIPMILALDYFYGLSFSLAQIPFVAFSPVVSLLSLLRYDLSLPGGLWWAPIAQSILGLVCFGVAHAIDERQSTLQRAGQPLTSSAPEIAPSQESLPLPMRLLMALFWPLNLIGKIFRAVFGALLRVYLWATKQLRWANERIVARFARWNNPVLSDELRRRLNREWWIVQWLAIAFAALTIFLLSADVLNWIATGAGVSGMWVSGLAIGCALFSSLGALLLGRGLDRERANGTLIFLFLTPLTEREILLGKWVPALLYGAVLISTALPWLALGALIDALRGEFGAFTLALCGLIATVVHWLFVSAVAMFCAVRARRPNDGVAWALLAVLVLDTTIFSGLFYLFGREGWLDLHWQLYLLAVIGACILLAIAGFAWRTALGSLRKLRYNDQTQRGKGAS